MAARHCREVVHRAYRRCMRPETNPPPIGVQGPLSEAFCSDLRSGSTPVNSLGSVKDGNHTPVSHRMIAAAVLSAAGILAAIAACTTSAPTSLPGMNIPGSSVSHSAYTP